MAGNREIVQNQLDVIKENRVILMGDFFYTQKHKRLLIVFFEIKQFLEKRTWEL